jgi:hypothetical protein
VLLGTRIALEAGEAAAEQATVEVAFELAPHERWQRRSLEARRHRRIERLDVVAYDRVERRCFRAMALVAARAPNVESSCGKPHPGGS